MMIKAKDWLMLPGSLKRQLLRQAMQSKGGL